MDVSTDEAVWSDLGNFARRCFAGCLTLANLVGDDDFNEDFENDFGL